MIVDLTKPTSIQSLIICSEKKNVTVMGEWASRCLPALFCSNEEGLFCYAYSSRTS